MRRGLDLTDVQGNVLRPFRFGQARHLFVRVNDAVNGREWLGRLAEQYVSDARKPDESPPSPDTAVNVALSAPALAALGVPPPVLAGFSEEFRAGMAARADVLGDRGPSAPEMWRPGFGVERPGTPPPLAIVSAYGLTDSAVKDLAGRLLAQANQFDLHEGAAALNVGKLKNDREHFGFADGFAQPEVAGAPTSSKAASRGKPLPAGEFLLGHRDVEYAVAPGPPGPLGRNGTYMVYRELAQDVAGYRRYIEAQEAETGLPAEMVGAKMVGRWPDGSPLIVAPERPDHRLTAKDTFDPGINDFLYGKDPDGIRCPLGAHIRRVNPRDALGFGDRMSRRHRMIRRGMPYGPAFADEPAEERGLAFICFVASIRRQFEFVQAQWCNDGNAFGLGTERDPLVGQSFPAAGTEGPGKMTIPDTPSAHFLSPLPDLVRTRGGEYFFLPSLSALRWLSESGWSRPVRQR
jgi:Dyp-type peroxidase family